MNTNKYKVSAIAMGVALALGSVSALAQPPVTNPAVVGARAVIAGELGAKPPTFNTNEQVGLGLIESVVSLLASRTNDFGCATKTYDLSVVTTDPTNGYAEIGGGVDAGGTTLNGVLGPTKDIGTRLKVDQAPGINLLSGIQVVEYNGAHGWSRTNEIFNSDASITLKDKQTTSLNKYREVDIKDYFKQVIAGRSWEFDWGLEDIKKLRSAPFPFYYPVQKWQEASWYQHENGGEGSLWVYKYLVIPRSAAGCQIRVEAPEGSLFNGSGEFELDGTVTVGRVAGPVFPGPQ